MIGQFTAISDSELGLEIGEFINQHAHTVCRCVPSSYAYND